MRAQARPRVRYPRATLAIVLSVGLVVENVERHLQLGQRPLDAAINAACELVCPIIAMTITLAAVYTPIGIQGGLAGALFREFAFTLAGAVIVSGVVVLTLSPIMGRGFCAQRMPSVALRDGSTADSMSSGTRAH